MSNNNPRPPRNNSTTTTFSNTQMSNLYWCDQCQHAVRITSPRIQCPRCNSWFITRLRNPDFHYTWSNVDDGIRPPRLPPQPVPGRQNYSINDSRSARSVAMSLLFRPRPQRRSFQSLSNGEINSAAPPISSSLEVERMADQSSSLIIPRQTDPLAVTRDPSFLIPPGLNPTNFLTGPEMNVISSMIIGIIAERAEPQQAWPLQVVPELDQAPREQPAAPQSPPAQSLEAPPGQSSLQPSSEPAVMPDALATVKVKPEHVKNLNDMSFCGVCLEDFEVGENVIQLPCKHRFHNVCIVRWLFSNNGCPDCRSDQLPPRN